ncbi:MAG TPA: hypothetical protein VER96_21625 [Polyangiaceae bacterium]|nr:hypothetical protein [Polyangiaceae bacterium]
MTGLRGIGLALLLGALSGCNLVSGGVNVEPVAVATQKPGNVALYVSVSKHGNGVLGLQKEDFKVYENGAALDNEQIKLTLLSTNPSTSRHATVLVDMSKALKREEKKSIADALRPFIARLRQREPVSLYAFDGAEKAHLVQEYTQQETRSEPDEKDTSMDRLLGFSRKDSSTSLYSAVIDGADQLSASLRAEGRPVENGTLIVVALNPDSAGRVEDSKLRDFVDQSPHHIFLMTVGTAASSADISFIGKTGGTRAGSPMTMGAPLNDVANAVDDELFRNYVVAYCSPGRAGKRDLKLEVTTRDAKGNASVGSYSTTFDADGFGPSCDPGAAPQFVVAKREAPALPTSKAVASNTKPGGTKAKSSGAAHEPREKAPAAAAPAATPTPAPASNANASPAAPIAEPPSGLGYE